MENKEFTWTNYYGKTQAVNEIESQHLCNIYWFSIVFWGSVPKEIIYELKQRFGINYLMIIQWKPLPIPNEIRNIKMTCKIESDGSIYFKDEKIGSLSHIPEWDK